MAAVETITIPSRFNGPPDSGNGGYTCGLVARALGGGPGEVMLKAPPPLDRPLEVERSDGGRVVARDGNTVVAEGRAAEVEVDAPAPVAPDVAAASAGGPFLDAAQHPFPTCFVCGPLRDEGDGLRIFVGPVDAEAVDPGPGDPEAVDPGPVDPGPVDPGAVDPGPVDAESVDPGSVDPVFAAAWTPPASLAGADRALPEELVWAALDCPTSGPVANDPTRPGFLPIVLARLAVHIHAPVTCGEPHVVMAWKLGVDGRKRQAAAALYDAEGALCAVSQALWIELRPAGG